KGATMLSLVKLKRGCPSPQATNAKAGKCICKRSSLYDGFLGQSLRLVSVAHPLSEQTNFCCGPRSTVRHLTGFYLVVHGFCIRVPTCRIRHVGVGVQLYPHWLHVCHIGGGKQGFDFRCERHRRAFLGWRFGWHTLISCSSLSWASTV